MASNSVGACLCMTSIVLLVAHIFALDGLSVDWVNGKLYWTDASLRCIEVYDVSSGIRRELLRTGLNTIPRAIVVDPANR